MTTAARPVVSAADGSAGTTGSPTPTTTTTTTAAGIPTGTRTGATALDTRPEEPPRLLAGSRRWLFAGLVAVGFAQAGAAVAWAALVSRLAGGTGPLAALLPWAAGLVAATAALVFGERVLAERLGQSWVADVRTALFRRATAAPARQPGRGRSTGGASLRMMGNLSALRRWAGLGLARLAVAVPLLAGCLAAFTIIAPPVAAAVGVVAGAGLATTVALSPWLRSAHGDGDGGEQGADPAAPRSSAWLRALYACVVADLHHGNSGAFISLASLFDEGQVLARGLTYYLFPETGAAREQILGYVGSAVPAASDADGAHGTRPPRTDLMLLFALLSRDAELFWDLMAARLEEHREKASAASPASLLPLPEIAFAAMAVRLEGWEPPFESDYLPRRLMTGEKAHGRARVGPYGKGKDAGALKALSQGPLRVERPKAFQGPGLDRLLDAQDEMCQKDLGPTGVWRSEILPTMRSSALQRTAGDEVRRFRYRSFADPQGNDSRQVEALANASQAAAAAFAIALSDGESVEVTIGGTTAPMPCVPMTGDISTSTLTFAIECALSAGYRRALDFLLSPTVTEATPSGYKGGPPVFDSYADVLLSFLGEQGEFGAEVPASERTRAAMDQALADLASCPAIPGVAIPPVVLLSQLVANDRDGFALALADALEAHRDAFSVGESAKDVDGCINLRILALACLARARGWELGVDSEYLPRGVIDNAAARLTSV